MTNVSQGAYYLISIDGKPVTSIFAPLLISMTIKDSEGGKSDSLDIELDDEAGQIILPRTGATIHAEIGWKGGGCVTFEGKTDEPHSKGARGGGMTLSINAKSADPKGKGKEPQSRHKDKAKFGDVAKEWGQKAGYSVKVDSSLSSIARDYWELANESFHAWGARIARELGATFKVQGSKAVFVPRDGSNAASGAAMAVVWATRPGNVISWDLTPNFDRMVYESFRVRWYDAKKAKWVTEKVTGADAAAKASLTHRFKAVDKDHAKQLGKSNKDEADRKKGGGTVHIIGDPAARAQAKCVVSGVRAGIDGTYKITEASHTISRGSGYDTELTLEQPSGSAGSDKRKASK
jgi:phage protein D